MPTPGATRSGLGVPSMAAGPRELNAATTSSARSGVPLSSLAPTVSTHGALPGAAMLPYCGVAARTLAEVAGGRDDDDAGADGAEGGLGERVGVVGLVDAGRDRQVDAPGC